MLVVHVFLLPLHLYYKHYSTETRVYIISIISTHLRIETMEYYWFKIKLYCNFIVTFSQREHNEYFLHQHHHNKSKTLTLTFYLSHKSCNNLLLLFPLILHKNIYSYFLLLCLYPYFLTSSSFLILLLLYPPSPCFVLPSLPSAQVFNLSFLYMYRDYFNFYLFYFIPCNILHYNTIRIFCFPCITLIMLV